MEPEDNPTSPYEYHEQERIMRDLYASLRQAQDEHDVSRTFYLVEVINDFDHD